MKPQPQDWSQLAAIKVPQRRGEPVRSAAPIAPRRAAPTAASDATLGHAPAASSAPPAPAGSLPALPAALLLAIALVASCLLLGHQRLDATGVLLCAAATAALQAPIMFYFGVRARASAAAAAAAQRQDAVILGAMREGLFVIGRDLRLRAPCSSALSELLHLPTPCGQRFEQLFRPLLDEETLAATVTFLRLLWNDDTDRDAIEALNPLTQVEIRLDNAHGGSLRRTLSFSFRRVAGGEPADDGILVMVTDVTDTALLARELEQAKADGDSQPELLLQLVRSDPQTLTNFLDDADTAFRKCNAVLSASGIGQPHLQRKLAGVLRELHVVAAESQALPFASIARRLQSIDDLLSELCARASLSGSDFLPVVIGLDDLMSHAATMRAIHQHIVLLRAASAALAALDHDHSADQPAPVVLELS